MTNCRYTRPLHVSFAEPGGHAADVNALSRMLAHSDIVSLRIRSLASHCRCVSAVVIGYIMYNVCAGSSKV